MILPRDVGRDNNDPPAVSLKLRCRFFQLRHGTRCQNEIGAGRRECGRNLTTNTSTSGMPRELVDRLWNWAESGEELPQNNQGVLERLNAAPPDLDQFTSRYAAAALDAVSITAAAYTAALNQDCEAAARAGELVIESLTSFVYYARAEQRGMGAHVTDRELEAEVTRDSVVVAEVKRQKNLIAVLRSLILPAPGTIAELRKASATPALGFYLTT